MMVLLKRLESLRLFEDAGSQLESPAVSSLVQPTSPDKTNQHSCQTLAEEQTCAIAAVVWQLVGLGESRISSEPLGMAALGATWQQLGGRE